MKKLLCLFLAALLVCPLFVFPAFAASGDRVVIHLSDDLAGCTQQDYEKFAVITSGNCEFDTAAAPGPVFAADYAGTAYEGELTAGRTYSVYYYFTPGENLNPAECETQFDCDSGVKVISYSAVKMQQSENAPERTDIAVFAQVTVRGSFLQRITGMILDLIAKIKAFQLY